MRLSLSLTVFLVATPAFSSEDLAQQIDRVAPLVSAADFAALGGPNTPETIVEGIDGRWFTLVNTVRNWEGSGAADLERLQRAIERTCADTWENIVTYEATGPGTFRVVQQSPEGEDQGTFDMVPQNETSRVFTTTLDDDYIKKIFDIDADAPAQVQAAALAEIHALMGAGLEIWRPTPDLMVNIRANDEPEVWGRCPG